jgi:hypothetical protein
MEPKIDCEKEDGKIVLFATDSNGKRVETLATLSLDKDGKEVIDQPKYENDMKICKASRKLKLP